LTRQKKDEEKKVKEKEVKEDGENEGKQSSVCVHGKKNAS
jgi:hypothetical protein